MSQLPSPPIHQRPNESCLEPFRKQIAERRRLLWPYRRLVEWLGDEHQLTVDWSTIRNFCDVRNIHKGTGEVGVTQASAKQAKADADAWNFNTEGPLEIDR